MFLMRSVCLIFILFIASWGGAQEQGPGAHPQGQLWALLESGHTESAAQLEHQLKQVLESAPLEKVRILGGGLSESWLVQFSDNVFAVVKPADRLNPRSPWHEVAAYRMDRLLNLHIVPLTVLRSVGEKTYSVQLYYPASQRFQAKSSLQSADAIQIKDLQVFDTVIANQDRHIKDAHNVLEGLEGRLVAFDHGRTFAADYQPYKTLAGGSVNLKQALLAVTAADLNLLQDVLNPNELSALHRRVTEVQNSVERMSWSEKTLAPLAVSKKSFEAPSELNEKSFIDMPSFRKYFSAEVQVNPLETLKSLSQDPIKNGIAKKMFTLWPSLSTQQKAELFNTLQALAPKEPLIPEQVQRLLRHFPNDLVILDQVISGNIKSSFAYAVLVHETATRSSSLAVSEIASKSLKDRHGRSVLSRSLYNLPESVSRRYQDVYIEALERSLKSGELRLSDLLALPAESQQRVQELISGADRSSEITEILRSKISELDFDRKSKAEDFIAKIKRAVKAPLCRAIFN